jgi:peptide-methionine (S)-S-oxide reductase
MESQAAYFGGGCFWCVEAVFRRLKGVVAFESGFAGGSSPNPTYESHGDHAEIVKVEFDPKVISYTALLSVFFSSHDPTTPNRQGNDVGTSYRSIILYTNNAQKKEAEKIIKEIKDAVTIVQPFEKFFKADNTHQNYYEKNSNEPYCMIVINPKIAKLQKNFTHLLKDT